MKMIFSVLFWSVFVASLFNNSFGRVIDNNGVLLKSDAIFGGMSFHDAFSEREHSLYELDFCYNENEGEYCHRQDINIYSERIGQDLVSITFPDTDFSEEVVITESNWSLMFKGNPIRFFFSQNNSNLFLSNFQKENFEEDDIDVVLEGLEYTRYSREGQVLEGYLLIAKGVGPNYMFPITYMFSKNKTLLSTMQSYSFDYLELARFNMSLKQ